MESVSGAGDSNFSPSPGTADRRSADRRSPGECLGEGLPNYSTLGERPSKGQCCITGIGLVTPLGSDANSTWNSLIAGRAIKDHARVEGFDGPDRVLKLAHKATSEAIAHAGWNAEKINDPETALIVATSKGPIVDWLNGNLDLSGLGQIAHELSSLFPSLGTPGEGQGGGGPRLTLSSACATGLHALIRGCMMLTGGEAQRVIIVAAEASVHPLFISSFQRLGILAPPGFGCRPFDLNRKGFVVSEAAAAICLENVGWALPTTIEGAVGHAHPTCITIENWAMGADAYDLIAPDPQSICLRRMLQKIIDNRPIDFIHAHGTGTIPNDPLELAALEATIAPTDSAPAVYSHKAALGHSLGAAGLVAVVINCLIHQHQMIPPNIHADSPLPTRHISLCKSPQNRLVSRSIAISSGFGGPIAAISLMAL